jgi:hypothetical protein
LLIGTFTLVESYGDCCAVARPLARSDDGGKRRWVANHDLLGESNRRKRSSPEPVADGAAAARFDRGPHCVYPIYLTLSRTGDRAGKVDFQQKSALLLYHYRRYAREGVDILLQFEQ